MSLCYYDNNYRSIIIELRCRYIHILAIAFVLHHLALSDGCHSLDLNPDLWLI